jgi:hypothetical protein
MFFLLCLFVLAHKGRFYGKYRTWYRMYDLVRL